MLRVKVSWHIFGLVEPSPQEEQLLSVENFTVLTILTAFRRPYLEEQIKCIKNQTKKSDILVWQNRKIIDVEELCKREGVLHTCHMNWSTRYHGRFLIPMFFPHDYCCIIDDDVMPGKGAIEEALRVSQKYNDKVLVGSAGCIIKGFHERSIVRTLYKTGNELEVDYIGQSWFFRRHLVKYLWDSCEYDYVTGEDMEFSRNALELGGIKSIVHSPGDSHLNFAGLGDYGADEHASYKKHWHHKARRKFAIELIKKGWKVKHRQSLNV